MPNVYRKLHIIKGKWITSCVANFFVDDKTNLLKSNMHESIRHNTTMYVLLNSL